MLEPVTSTGTPGTTTVYSSTIYVYALYMDEMNSLDVIRYIYQPPMLFYDYLSNIDQPSMLRHDDLDFLPPDDIFNPYDLFYDCAVLYASHTEFIER